MRLSPRSRDRKCSRSLGAGTGNGGASRNLGSSVLSFLYLCCSEVSDLCFPPGRLLFFSLSFFCCSVHTVENGCLRWPSWSVHFLLLWAHTVPGTRRSSSQQKLPRTVKVSQGPGRASDWSSWVRCPSLIQSAVAKGGSCALGPLSGGWAAASLGRRLRQILEEENTVAVIL